MQSEYFLLHLVAEYIYLKLLVLTPFFDSHACATIDISITRSLFLSVFTFISLTIILFIVYAILDKFKFHVVYKYFHYILFLSAAYLGIIIIDELCFYYVEVDNRLLIYASSMFMIALLAIVFNFITKLKYER